MVPRCPRGGFPTARAGWPSVPRRRRREEARCEGKKIGDRRRQSGSTRFAPPAEKWGTGATHLKPSMHNRRTWFSRGRVACQCLTPPSPMASRIQGLDAAIVNPPDDPLMSSPLPYFAPPGAVFAGHPPGSISGQTPVTSRSHSNTPPRLPGSDVARFPHGRRPVGSPSTLGTP